MMLPLDSAAADAAIIAADIYSALMLDAPFDDASADIRQLICYADAAMMPLLMLPRLLRAAIRYYDISALP